MSPVGGKEQEMEGEQDVVANDTHLQQYQGFSTQYTRKQFFQHNTQQWKEGVFISATRKQTTSGGPVVST
jgi:tRNA/tmRNA/rRNA uracil-C5-methylase (TrmA/RlmC/RlmD family)